METMKLFYVAILLFLLVVFATNMLRTKKVESTKQKEKEIESLNAEIQEKYEILKQLTHQLENQTIDRVTSLSKIETDILDLYENSNIKLPVEIIEELSRMKLQTEKEVFDYIENQRYFWKLENTKKPYVRK